MNKQKPRNTSPSYPHRFLLLPALFALPIANACEPTTITETQADDSIIEISIAECNDGERHITVFFQEDSNSESKQLLERVQSTDEAPTGGAELIDLDEDGFYEIAVRGMCGAGPNCEGEVYQFNQENQSLQMLFSGGYADLFMLDDHLIESGRNGCCAWEFHAYDLENPTRPLTYEEMDLMITISVDADDNGTIRSVQCTFMDKQQDEWVVTMPPADEWLSLCEQYDQPYTLVQPE